jgi:hypothetical protein
VKAFDHRLGDDREDGDGHQGQIEWKRSHVPGRQPSRQLRTSGFP